MSEEKKKDDLEVKINTFVEATLDIPDIPDINEPLETIVDDVEDRMKNAFSSCAEELDDAELEAATANTQPSPAGKNLKHLFQIRNTLQPVNRSDTVNILAMMQEQSVMIALLVDQVTGLTQNAAQKEESEAADAVTRENVATSLEKTTKKTEANFKQIIKQTATQSKVVSLIKLTFDTINRLKTMINLLRPSQYIPGNNIIVNILRLIVIFLELSAFLSFINLGFEYFGVDGEQQMINIAKKFSSELAKLYIMVFNLLLTGNSPIFKIFKALGQGFSENKDIQQQYTAVVDSTSEMFSTILDKLRITEIIGLIIAGKDIITDIPGSVVNAASAAASASATFVSQSLAQPIGRLKEAVAEQATGFLTGAFAGAFSYFRQQIPDALPASASATINLDRSDNTRSLSGLSADDFSAENFNALSDILRSDFKEVANFDYDIPDADDREQFGGGGPDFQFLSDFLILNLQIAKQLTFLCDICIIINMKKSIKEGGKGKGKSKSRKHMKRKTHKRIRHKNKKGSKRRYKLRRHSKRRNRK
jgi:hypothetical protein